MKHPVSDTWTQIAEEACTSQNFNPAVLPYTTLITATPRSRQCPYLGRYSVSGLMGRHAAAQVGGVGAGSTPGEEGAPCSDHQQFQSLAVGCGSEDKMEFHSACSTEAVSTYSCHGSWEDNGTSYLIASPSSRKSVGARRYCFIYTDTGAAVGGGTIQAAAGMDERASLLQVASVTESCHRNLPISGMTWTFNLTAYGQSARLLMFVPYLSGECAESASTTKSPVPLSSLVSVILLFTAVNSR
uniref:Uncharacterized protein n=1 Tax=Timema bartmani TaxID=61472 RepID=A0A7R9I5C7_9NEOP|nr:unnamed protein product [Timema bartmani]